MLRTLAAHTFIEPAIRGGNFPMLLRCREAGADGTTAVYVKTRAGYGDRPAAPGVELFATLLARELGVRAPEPVLVDVPEGFAAQVFEHPRHRELLERSAGLNFGTVALRPDWKTWPVDMSARAFSEEMVEAILVFDALVQHTDREAENPNLLWRGHELAVIDHEKCFGYLALATDARRPWRAFFQHDPLRTHCLREAGRSLAKGKDFGRRMWESLLGLELEARVPELAATATGAFPESAVEIGRISAYLEALFRDIEDFLDYARHAFSR
jgi:hypothetical protein